MVAQGTSTDPGPYYLGAGSSYMQLIQVKNDLSTLIQGCYKFGVPFIVSVGGPGHNQSLAAVLEVINEITQEQKIGLKLAVIQGELSKEWLMAKLDAGGKTERLVRSKYLKEKLEKELVRESKHIVAQMGPEPIMKALETPGLHGVVTGAGARCRTFCGFASHERVPCRFVDALFNGYARWSFGNHSWKRERWDIWNIV